MIATIHLGATVAMTAIVWFVQVVHYPLLALVGDRFVEYEHGHSERTSLVVGPLMATEAATALVLAVRGPDVLTLTGLALLGVIWASTALVQVRCHRHLGRGFDTATHRLLVRSNWVRTAAWTARSGIAIGIVQ